MGDLETAGQVPGEGSTGAPATAPVAGGEPQGGAAGQPTEKEGDHVAAVVERIRAGRFDDGDEAMIRRWNSQALERTALGEKVKELEGRPGELKTFADRILAGVPIEDQHLYRQYREDCGNDEVFVEQMLQRQAEATAPKPGTGAAPAEETDEERIRRYAQEAARELVSPILREQGQRTAQQNFDTTLDQELKKLGLDEKTTAHLKRNVRAQAQVAVQDIRTKKRPNVLIAELVPSLVKGESESLSALLSAKGAQVTTELVKGSVPAKPAPPAVSRPSKSEAELAEMDVDSYWDAQSGQGAAPAEGAAG